METSFYILIYIRTLRGFECFAKFYIGNKEEAARDLFQKLRGHDDLVDESTLQIDLMETRNNLPVNLKVMGCTLAELAENCKTITKEAFKIFTLDP